MKSANTSKSKKSDSSRVRGISKPVVGGANSKLKKCNWCCKTLPLHEFGTHEYRGEVVVYSKCKTCRPKHNATSNSSKNNAIVKSKYKKTEAGKASEAKYKSSDKGKASKSKYKLSDKGKASDAKYNSSDRGKASDAKYKSSDKGKASDALYRSGSAFKASRDRQNATKRKRRLVDPGYATMGSIACAAYRLIIGRYKTSRMFVERTSFASEAEFRDHMELQANHIGFELEDHATKWQMEHKIPVQAYDGTNPEDVRRCWSASNMHAMTPEENNKKGVKIIDSYVLEVDTDVWPLSWNGKLPSEKERMAFYERAHSKFDMYDSDSDDDDDSD